MKKILIVSFVLSCGLAISQNNSKNHSQDRDKIEAERTKLKNAAFCTCLYKSFPEKDSVFINEGSAAAYLELGIHSLDAYTKVMDAATSYSKKQYQSKYSRNLVIMKCLDFYNSKDLNDLVKSFDDELKR